MKYNTILWVSNKEPKYPNLSDDDRLDSGTFLSWVQIAAQAFPSPTTVLWWTFQKHNKNAAIESDP